MCKDTLMETLEIKYIDVGEDFLVASMPVSKKVHQPDGILNGGATMALAESVGSPTSYLVLDLEKYTVRGYEFSANHLRSVKSGVVTATSRILHQGKTVHLVEVIVLDERQRIISRCKLSNFIVKK